MSPIWPVPSIQLIQTSSALSMLVERVHDHAPHPLGLAVWTQPSYLLALAFSPAASQIRHEVFVVDIAKIDDIHRLQSMFTSTPQAPGPYFVCHNAHEVMSTLARLQLHPSRIGCTKIAATLLAEGLTNKRNQLDLPHLVDRILHHSLPELHQFELIASQTPLLLTEVLACMADVLVPLMRALTPLLRKHQLAAIYELECRLLPAVVAMERAGIHIDASQFQRIAETWQAEREQSEDPARVQRLDKLISTFGHWPQSFVELDGRIRCHLDPIATDSGRFACSNPNLQQVPSEHTAPGLRACFSAKPGYVFVIADYAQIELRVAAHIAPCTALREVFMEGRDPHRATAATLAGKSEAEVTDHERKLAKAINFGFLFGMGAQRFQDYARASYHLELDRQAALQAREAFFSTFPGIAAWHRKVAALGRQAQHQDIIVRTAIGRRKRFKRGQFSFTAALNIPVQGTAAEGFKQAMIELEPVVHEFGGQGVLCIHDEYVAEIPEKHAEEACQHIRQCMERAMATVVSSVPIVVEARVATNWAEKTK